MRQCSPSSRRFWQNEHEIMLFYASLLHIEKAKLGQASAEDEVKLMIKLPRVGSNQQSNNHNVIYVYIISLFSVL